MFGENYDLMARKVIVGICTLFIFGFSVYFVAVGGYIIQVSQKPTIVKGDIKVLRKINYAGGETDFDGCVRSIFGNKVCNYEIQINKNQDNRKFIVASDNPDLKDGDIDKIYIMDGNASLVCPFYYTWCDGLVYIALGLMLFYISIQNAMFLFSGRKIIYDSNYFMSELNNL